MPRTVNARLILRNDFQDVWVSRNPVLAKGEIGAEIDTGLLKLGDGLSPYNDLDYINRSNGRDGDGALITISNSKFTVANYGKSYYKYDANLGTEIKVDETDLTKWPSTLELEIKNGIARWVKLPDSFTFDKAQGIINGAVITLARNPLTNLEAATKGYVDNQIAAQIAAAPHLKREIVNQLPNLLYADRNTIYMIKDNSATGADKYKEYLVINDEFVQVGDTSVDLTNYVEKPASYVEGNIVTFGSNGALIDSNVSINNINTLNVATNFRLGGVLSSSENNKISVDNYGYMEVNNVTTDKIINGIDEFILNGGGA